MLVCKRCDGQQFIKKGTVSGKQRYKCKECNLHFREGNNRTHDKIVAKKALCVLLYSMAKGSFRMLGRILDTHYTLVYRWIREFGESLPEPVVSGNVTEMEFDAMWHFLRQKNSGFSKPLIVAPLRNYSKPYKEN